MPKKQILFAEMERIFKEKGGEALKRAKNEIASIYETDSNLSKALQYFSSSTLLDPMPVFPALVTISCEAVGGTAEIAVPFGEAAFLIASAADLHDDIIDQSFSKGPKKTVFGRFGSIETLLAGDTLLVRGLALLNEARAAISKEQGEAINLLAMNAIFELCIAESLETRLRPSKLKIKPNDYNEIIRLKAGFPEFTFKIGAIIGEGDVEYIETLGRFGRTFGVISTVADEFSDLLNSDELINRLKNECPPLPLICALQNRKAKKAILPLLMADLSNGKTHNTIASTVLGTVEVKAMVKSLQATGESEIERIKLKIKRKSREELETILLAPLEFLNAACFS
jgi:geranylgeranyl pyrophosphate synthase